MVQNNKITQENDSHLITIISYLPVVDDGDGVPPPADNHGANLNPGSLLRIEFQDVVTCIVLYYYTNCIGNNVIMSSHQGITVCTCDHHFIVQCGASQSGPG